MGQSMKIKLLVLDVDGTLTDGKIYYTSSGEEIKAFDIKDGLGIKEIAAANGIQCAVITGRKSPMVERRCADLNIAHLYQGVSDKTECLKSVLDKEGISFEETAYMGDDLNDLKAMGQCKIVGCPSDAAEQIKERADFVSKKKGGDGAVRDFIEYLITLK